MPEKTTWDLLLKQRAQIEKILLINRAAAYRDLELNKMTMRIQKWFEKKGKALGEPMRILQRRTIGTALDVIEKLNGVQFDQVAKVVYLFCRDLKMEQFTKLYEAQIEYAGVAPEKFAKGLHKFFNDVSRMIQEENMFQAYAEFLSISIMASIPVKTDEKAPEYKRKVIDSYLCLLLQQSQYLKPEKFDFYHVVCGMSTTGEILTMPDVYPQFDNVTEDITRLTFKAMAQGLTPDIDHIVCEASRKHGLDIKNVAELNYVQNADRTFSSSLGAMLPMINEYTFDILPAPENIFQCAADPFLFIHFSDGYDIKTLEEMLTKRARTLPPNGMKFFIAEPDYSRYTWEEIFLKEAFYDDSVILLYKMKTIIGEFCGFYNTKTREFFSPMHVAYQITESVRDTVERLILYTYACAVTRAGTEMLTNFSKNIFFGLYKEDKDAESGEITREFIHFGEYPVTMYSVGGKLRQTYRSSGRTYALTGARAGNTEKYEAGKSSIQGFIRKVGEGKRPSEEAVERAKTLGFDLAPDETYVQPFIRTSWKLKRVTS